MTPNEKARYLIDRFNKIDVKTVYVDTNQSSYVNESKLMLESAIDMSIEFVDILLDEQLRILTMFPISLKDGVYSSNEFYNSVKTELIKYKQK